MKVRYRIGDLELRLNDLPKDSKLILHSPWSEIVQWSKRNDKAEHCWTIATFEYDKDGYPELHYCGRRPLELEKDNIQAFLSLIEEGYKYVRVNGKIEKENLLAEWYD